MLYSTDRILTTHAGSLPRPPELRDMVLAKANGTAIDPAAFDARLRSAVAETVRALARARGLLPQPPVKFLDLSVSQRARCLPRAS